MLGSQTQFPLSTGAVKSAGFVLRAPPGRLALKQLSANAAPAGTSNTAAAKTAAIVRRIIFHSPLSRYRKSPPSSTVLPRFQGGTARTGEPQRPRRRLPSGPVETDFRLVKDTALLK